MDLHLSLEWSGVSDFETGDKRMASQAQLISSERKAKRAPWPTKWFKVGVLTAFSAMAGGMAAAWYYRKTLLQLRQAENLLQNQETGPSSTNMDDDL